MAWLVRLGRFLPQTIQEGFECTTAKEKSTYELTVLTYILCLKVSNIWLVKITKCASGQSKGLVL